MFEITSNQVIKISKGDDSGTFNVRINKGTSLEPIQHKFYSSTEVYYCPKDLNIIFDANIFCQKVSTDGIYKFEYNWLFDNDGKRVGSLGWYLADEKVSLSDYGLQCTTTPHAGDSFIIYNYKEHPDELQLSVFHINDEPENFILQKIYRTNSEIITNYKFKSSTTKQKQTVDNNAIVCSFERADTDWMHPGEYLYQIKAKIYNKETEQYEISTIISKHSFIVEGLCKKTTQHSDTLVGTLNQKFKLNDYKGGSTNTADVEIIDNTIYVNARVDAEEITKNYMNVTKALNKKADALALGDDGYWYLMSGGQYGTPVAGPYNLGAGGGGSSSGGSGSTITEISIKAVDWPTRVAFGSDCDIQVNWSSTKNGNSTGNGTLILYVNDNKVETKKNIAQGIQSFSLTRYLTTGTNSIEVRVMDAYSNVDKVISQITTIAVSLDSTFNDNRIFTDDITFTYIPTAAVSKTVYFLVDGRQFTTKKIDISGEQQTLKIPNPGHGAHTLEVYFTCILEDEVLTSNKLTYSLICEKAPNKAPIIASIFDSTEIQEQYVTFNIPYRVYTPDHNLSNIQLSINDELVKTLSVGQDTQYWEYKPEMPGQYIFSIKCGNTVKVFNINVKSSTINVQPVTEDLSLQLSAYGRSNAEEHPEIWEDTDRGVSCELTNFNFVSDGWIKDTEGNTVLRVTGDARVTIPVKPFLTDFRATGKTIELEIATSTVKDYEALILQCWSGDRGFYLTPQIAKLKSQKVSIETQYKEEEHVRITFVVEKNVENRLMCMYLNGIICGAVQYELSDNFRQLSPVDITIGSNDATIDIYNIRIYDNNLDRRQVVNNWIADTQNATLRADRYIHNDNYNDLGELVINKLPDDLPHIVWDIDPLPQFKGDKRKGQAYYVDPTNQARNFKLPTDSEGKGTGDYNVQGTSSAGYPVKNIRLKSKNGFIDDNLKTNKTFSITPDGIGVNYFTYKVDYASSEGANNVELTRLYNDICKAIGILTPPQRQNPKVRVGIDGFPIVAFHRDSEGKDTFCTKANFNNDKANEDVYGFIEGDESWEVTNNSAAGTRFKEPASAETFGDSFEIRFPDEDGYNDISRLAPMTQWVCSTDPEQATNEPLSEPAQFTYSNVIRSEDGTYSKTNVTSKIFTVDSDEYRLTKFKAELEDWFNLDSTLFYYLFTHLFLMVDSRAKNAFPTYFKSRATGDGGDKWFWLPYDMDTALGINNEGKLVFDYSLEDTDKIDGANVFNGQDSVLWNNLRIMFDGEIGELYSTLRTSGSLLSFKEVEKRFEDHQSKWSESIFNEDSYVKYIDVLKNGDNYLEMLQGSKAEQRKWWLYNRFKYFDSKYLAGEAKTDVFQFRAYGKGDITIVPYADIYATVSYANSAGAVVSRRAKRGQAYTLPNPLPTSASDQETYIYSASQLKSIGDLSPFKPDTIKAGAAVKLQELKIGDDSPGYENPNLKELTLGKNILLGTLDVRNCINLKQPINIEGCTNIEHVYFDNTKITGIELPVGGILKTLHLPNTLTNLTIRNQKLLTDLQIAGTENVQTLWLENIPSEVIDAKEFITKMPAGSAVRLIGFKQEFETVEEIENLYDLLDTMSGINAQGEDVPKAQVNGVISINSITYADYVNLLNRYPDIKISSPNIICTVTFMNENVVFSTQNIKMGEAAINPGIPTKESTIKYYYTFEGWSTSFDNIQQDIQINANFVEHIQIYEVKFNTQTTIVEVASQYVAYGELAALPDPPYIEGAIFNGWYTERGTINEYSFDNPIVGPTEIFAKWTDIESPMIIELTRKSYNTFKYTIEDNIAVTDFAITTSTEEPTEWTSITPSSIFKGEYIVEQPGTYYVWGRDSNNNICSRSIIAHSLITTTSDGATLNLTENGIRIESNTIIEGTEIQLGVILDSHYENLLIKVNYEETEVDTIYTVQSDTKLDITCTAKLYRIQFVHGDYGNVVDDQIVEYKHLIIPPDPQFDDRGFLLEGWYFEDELWDFITPVSTNMTLYAKWLPYQEPSIITITIPEDNTEITCNYFQTTSRGVHVDWSDGTDNFISNQLGNISCKHTFADAGTYNIKITCFEGTHLLGAGYNAAVIQPADLLTNVEFAWSLPHTSAYCFQDCVNLKAITLTRYMNKIEVGTFFGCTNLSSIEIPSTVRTLGDQSFQNSGITDTLVIPDTVTELGNQVFTNCIGLTNVIMPKNVNRLGEAIFSECCNLAACELPENLSMVPSKMFQNCTALTQMILEDNIESLGGYVFNGCINLSKVVLKNPELTMLDDLNFNNCLKLTSAGPIGGNYSIEFAWTTKIPQYAFSVVGNCSKLKTVVLPDTIKNIERSAFAFCTELQSINLPVGLETIGEIAFYSCSLLNIETIPSTVWAIGNYAFSRCFSITRFIIPASVTSIGVRAFQGCFAIRDILLYAASSMNKITIPEMSWVYDCASNLKIYILKAITDPALAYGSCWNFTSETERATYEASL